MSVYVSTTFLGDGSNIQNAIDRLHKAGIANVELGSNHGACDVKRLTLDPDSIYIAHNYFPPKDPKFVLNIASEDSKIREASIKFIKNTIKICQKLNIKYYTIHPGFLGQAAIAKSRGERNFDFKFTKSTQAAGRQKIIVRTIKIINGLYQYCANHNTRLLIENEGSKTSPDNVIFDSARELDSLERGVGDRLRFNFNLAHATLAGINLENEKIFRRFYNSSEFFEISEIQGDLDSHLPVANGRGKIARLIRKYSKDFAKKNVILEYRSTNIKEVNQSYSFVTKTLNSPPPKV